MRSMPTNARTSLTLLRWKYLVSPLSSIIGATLSTGFVVGEGDYHQLDGQQVEIARCHREGAELDSQGESDGQAVDHRAADCH